MCLRESERRKWNHKFKVMKIPLKSVFNKTLFVTSQEANLFMCLCEEQDLFLHRRVATENDMKVV